VTNEGVVVEVGSVGFDGNEGFVGKMGGRGGASNSDELVVKTKERMIVRGRGDVPAA